MIFLIKTSRGFFLHSPWGIKYRARNLHRSLQLSNCYLSPAECIWNKAETGKITPKKWLQKQVIDPQPFCSKELFGELAAILIMTAMKPDPAQMNILFAFTISIFSPLFLSSPNIISLLFTSGLHCRLWLNNEKLSFICRGKLFKEPLSTL